MLLGFMSLTLTVTQQPVSKICIPNSVAFTMLPCQREIQIKANKNLEMEQLRSSSATNRRFSWLPEKFVSLAAGGEEEESSSSSSGDSSSSSSSSSSSDYCTAKVMIGKY